MKALASFALAALLAGPCFAQETVDAETFCRKAGKNWGIYEWFLDRTAARAGAMRGAVGCDWTFTKSEKPDLLVTLDSKLLASPMAARQAILTARLSENHRGKTVEPLPRRGDDGLSRATTQDGALKLFELEAVRGARHFLLSVRMRDGSEVNYRIAAFSPSFLGVGIAELEKP